MKVRKVYHMQNNQIYSVNYIPYREACSTQFRKHFFYRVFPIRMIVYMYVHYSVMASITLNLAWSKRLDIGTYCQE